MSLTLRLYTAPQPGKASQLVDTVVVEPDANNAYPELVAHNARYFVPTPMQGAYREVQATQPWAVQG